MKQGRDSIVQVRLVKMESGKLTGAANGFFVKPNTRLAGN